MCTYSDLASILHTSSGWEWDHLTAFLFGHDRVADGEEPEELPALRVGARAHVVQQRLVVELERRLVHRVAREVHAATGLWVARGWQRKA